MTMAITRLDVNEVAEFLDNVESGNKLSKAQLKRHEKLKTRDLALLTLMLGTGIRVSECVGLDMKDVDFDNDRIKVVRKGGAESFVYFGDEVEEALSAYMEERKELNPKEGHENALFLSSVGKKAVRAVSRTFGEKVCFYCYNRKAHYAAQAAQYIWYESVSGKQGYLFSCRCFRT